MPAIRSLALVLCTLLLLAAPARAQDSAALASSLELGRLLNYTVSVSTEVNQAIGAETRAQQSSHVANASFRVVATDVEGIAQLEVTFERIGITLVENNVPTVTAVAVRDLDTGEAESNAATELASTLLDCTVRFLLTDDRTLEYQSGFEPFLQAAAGAEDLDPGFVGIFAPDRFTQVVAPIFDADGAAKVNVSQGLAWQTQDSIGLGAAGVFDITDNWRVSEFGDDAVTYEGTGDLTLRKPEGEDPARPDVNVNQFEITTNAVFDRADEKLATRTRTMSLGTTFTLGDNTLRQTQQTVVSITPFDG
ncbi:MAG: hypothetical protein AAGD00_03955 [Planctomycetota bacterium]